MKGVNLIKLKNIRKRREIKMTKTSIAKTPRLKSSLWQRIKENWQLYLLLLVPVIITIIYKYIPMYGIQIAFRDFKASKGYLGSEWVGFEWFERFFTSPN